VVVTVEEVDMVAIKAVVTLVVMAAVHMAAADTVPLAVTVVLRLAAEDMAKQDTEEDNNNSTVLVQQEEATRPLVENTPQAKVNLVMVQVHPQLAVATVLMRALMANIPPAAVNIRVLRQ